MAIRNATVKIENNKVVFSQEILDYFENLKNEETSEWIDKYFEILSDSSNFNSKKSEIHHIIPAFAFKDNNHTKRKETEPLANAIEGNKIKLSFTNHIIAHYCLWKIFNNWDSRNAIQQRCGQINIENLTQNEINEIAKIKKDCAKENQTKEEKDKYDRNYRKNHKKEMSEYGKKRRKEKKEELKQKNKIYREEHKDERKAYMIVWRKNHKKERKENKRKWDMRVCYDPIKQDMCSFCALKKRIKSHSDLYKDINVENCIIQNLPSKTTDNEFTLFDL